MFKSTAASQMIPAKSQILKPDVVSDVLAADQIRMLIPSYVSFLDPTDSYLKFKIRISTPRGIVVPDPKAAAHSLIRNLIIRDGGNTTSIESIEDYNSMMAMLRPYTQQSSIHHVRELYEGLQEDPSFDTGSLYYDAPQSLTGATDWASSIQTARVVKDVEVMIKLGAGILSSSVVPVGLMQGLRLQMDTEDPLRALVMLGGTLGEFGGGTAGKLQALAAAGFKPAANLTAGDLGTRGADAAANQFSLLTAVPSDALGKGNPFAIGDKIYLNTLTGDAEVVAGVVAGFYVSGGTLGLALIGQSAAAAPFPADATFTAAAGVIYYKASDRDTPFSYKLETETADVEAGLSTTPSYSLKDVEFIASSVSPPAAYQQGMMKKAMTKEGLSMDFITPELHRFNQVSTSGLVQSQIPTLARRGKAVFVQTIPQAWYRTLSKSGFSGAADSAKDYQFVKGAELVPSRPVPLGRYSQTVSTGTGQVRNEPLHTSELQKALINIGQPVYSLQRIAESFVLARSFNKYGQITDLSGETLSLRVDYSAAGSQKIFNQFIFKLARLTMAAGMTMVES